MLIQLRDVMRQQWTVKSRDKIVTAINPLQLVNPVPKLENAII